VSELTFFLMPRRAGVVLLGGPGSALFPPVMRTRLTGPVFLGNRRGHRPRQPRSSAIRSASVRLRAPVFWMQTDR